MDYITEASSAVLKDSHFLFLSTICQEVKSRAQLEFQQLNEELEYHGSLMAEAHHIIRLAVSLHEALQQVASLSPVYYFPLRAFITSMQEVFLSKDEPLVLFNAEKSPVSQTPEVKNQMVTELLLKYRPCLLTSHLAALKLLVSVALLRSNRLCSELESMALLRGLQDSGPSAGPWQPDWARPSWIPPQAHQQLVRLEKIPAFGGLIASLSAWPDQWQEYLCSPRSSVCEPVPCPSHCHLSLLQRALLWKTLVPDCLPGLADAMAVYQFDPPGQTANDVAHLIGDPSGLLQCIAKHRGAIILTLASPERDQWKSVHPLLLIDQLIHSGEETKEVTQLKGMVEHQQFHSFTC